MRHSPECIARRKERIERAKKRLARARSPQSIEAAQLELSLALHALAMMQ